MTASHGTDSSVAVFVQDLYFLSRITATASKADCSVTVVKPGDATPTNVDLAIVDLQFPGDWEIAVRAIAAAGGSVIAFGPHVDGALLKRARAAGCTKVMAKSKFVEVLTTLFTPQAQAAEVDSSS